MVVAVEWSTSSSFASTTSLIDHGNVASGAATSGVEIFIRHNGLNPITGCVFFIQPFTGTYSGAATAPSDFTELATTWGAASAAAFGGFQVNMDKNSAYVAAWGSSGTKDTIVSTKKLTFTARNDDGGGAVAVSAATGVPLHVDMGCTSEGVVPIGSTPGVGFKARLMVPAATTLGVRQFDQVLKYTYTS